ncbi:MAG TPA: patatin-like phospholipase family protein [Solirubrobacteraceae bacterium]|nr:patatin-like phospholipase family protein [Solirubrobacteraceae bacterium]
MTASGGPGTIAAILPGGGARGAYEVGALSELLPALEARGERVALWCGTSVGAINAVAFASRAHLSAREQTHVVRMLWLAMRKRDVMSPILGSGGLRTLARSLNHLVRSSSESVASLLDPAPLAGSLERWVNWDALDANVAQRLVTACVVATSLTSGEPVAFVAGADGPPKLYDDEVRYVGTSLRGEHVRASAAIPVLFPAVEVTTPRRAAGYYADGGTRLNSPIKPALNLGADRVIVIGLEPFSFAGGRPASPRGPSIADVAANVLDGMLVDQVAQDVRRLALINSFFVEDPASGTQRSPRSYRLARGHDPYRPISYALVSPRRHGEIGRIAQQVFQRRYGGLRSLRDLDYTLISRVLGSSSPARGELLSFLLFDAEFTAELIELGRRDAQRWLRRHPGVWCRDAAHDLNVGRVDHDVLKEQDALEEFRTRRR